MGDRDPLHRQILERLRGELDPQTFEDAVCDLLRDTFPGLVPIRGGSDAGRDGAIADGEGEAYPLVCTTGDDLIGNLTTSLDAYVRDGGSRRKVVLATSQELTPRRRRNLEKRALEKGFTLVQVVEQRGIADRLYRDAGWRRKLLRLAGTPAALSVVPLSKRPFLDLSPVGRDEDLGWLRTTSGDRVLSGQPGSGKTFLLQHLIREGWPGLFLVSRDETEIANALRAQAPGFVVIVDDAHADLDALFRLRRLREEIGAELTILATTWGGSRDSVLEALGLPVATRELELLTRPEILEVYRQAGITEDNTGRDLLRELVDQASNRPGLAATLALLWLRGAGRDVLTGQALSRHVRETFRSVIGADAAPLLAAFAIGGDRGMPLSAVAELLGMGLADLWSQTAALAAGGVLFEIEREVLAVRPHHLRSALIWTVFFPDPGQGVAFSYRRFLDRAPSLGSAVKTLVQARNYGVPIPEAELRELVSHADALDPWRKMTEDEPRLGEFILHSDVFAAWQGLTLSSEESARWVLDHYPGEILHLAHEALLRAPQEIIPRLLARAPEFRGLLPAHWGHPLRILARWIREPLTAPQESLRRRRLLAPEIVRYLRSGGDSAVGLQAVSLALSPKLETSSLDPGIGNVVTLGWGVLPPSSLPELGIIWAEVRGALPALPPESWPSLATFLWEWINPEHIAPEVEISEEAVRILHDLAASVILDLIPLVRASPGLAAELRPYAGRLGLIVDLPGDLIFETLFPEPDVDSMPEPDEAAINELVGTWSRESPRDIAQRLAHYESEAREIGRRWPRYTPRVCRELAARIEASEEWLKAFMEQNVPGDLAEPFLREILRRRPRGWNTLLETWLGSDSWGGTIASLLAGAADLPNSLTERSLARLGADSWLVYSLALSNEICSPMLRALFLSSNPEIALAAAVGSWLADPPSISGDLVDDRRQAVLRVGFEIADSGLRFDLARVLAADPILAFDWLRARVQSGTIPLDLSLQMAEKGPFRVALSVITAEQRSFLLAELVPLPGLEGLLPHLIGKDLALYRQLLSREKLRKYHLAPLLGFPEPEWIPLALEAARSGRRAQEIAKAAVSVPLLVIWGTGAEHWSRWKRSFSALEADPHEEIRAIGRAGQELIETRLDRVRKEERQTALHGL
jgi:hypothetical protein